MTRSARRASDIRVVWSVPAPCEQLWITPFMSKYWRRRVTRGQSTCESAAAQRRPAGHATPHAAAATHKVVDERGAAQLHGLVEERVALRHPPIEFGHTHRSVHTRQKMRVLQRRNKGQGVREAVKKQN